MAQWKITTPPAIMPVTAQEVADQTRLDDLTLEANWVTRAIADATDYAENETQQSLITRTITAVYYPDNSRALVAANPFPVYFPLELFRGPVQLIISVKNGAGNDVSYQRRTVGNKEVVQLIGSVIGPVTVVYVAGYGDAAASVPAAIRGGIIAHVAHKYRYREADADSIPTGLAIIYDKYAPGGIG
jgi:uncharacterized phiE125 gp8 family phage protein